MISNAIWAQLTASTSYVGHTIDGTPAPSRAPSTSSILNETCTWFPGSEWLLRGVFGPTARQCWLLRVAQLRELCERNAHLVRVLLQPRRRSVVRSSGQLRVALTRARRARERQRPAVRSAHRPAKWRLVRFVRPEERGQERLDIRSPTRHLLQWNAVENPGRMVQQRIHHEHRISKLQRAKRVPLRPVTEQQGNLQAPLETECLSEAPIGRREQSGVEHSLEFSAGRATARRPCTGKERNAPVASPRERSCEPLP